MAKDTEKNLVRNPVGIPANARSGGLMIFAPPGWGKSRLLGRRICFQDLINKRGQVIIDRVGGTINNLLDKVMYLPQEKQLEAGKRILYCNMAGSPDGLVCPFPMLYKWHESERVEHTSDRVVKLLSRIDKNFDNAAIYGLKRAEPLLRPVCQVLIVNSLPIYFAEDILVDPARFMPLRACLVRVRLKPSWRSLVYAEDLSDSSLW